MNHVTEVSAEVKTLVAEKLGIDEHEIGDGKSFADDFNMDSLDFYELIMSAEKKFNLRITDETAEKLRTVDSLVNYVVEHLTFSD
ncbi:MAG TPA: acyl carrier protein [Puia sp.]|nr:acyl carrier protein [Puia sp.]